jgi:MoxR-like ATPase
MPSDLTGHSIYDLKQQAFSFNQGPVFTNILLTDEINRSPPKTQSALLEVMQEAQVSVDGKTHVLQRPFLVIATQNPIEHEGTYPLPEAQVDRFMFKLLVDYPPPADEMEILGHYAAGRDPRRLSDFDLHPVMQSDDVLEIQHVVPTSHRGTENSEIHRRYSGRIAFMGFCHDWSKPSCRREHAAGRADAGGVSRS